MPDMRFAPPSAMRVTDRGGGLNQTSVRTYNERLLMSLLRQHNALSRMELGQHSGLSAQTISVMVRALKRDNLILAGEAQRGRVGPPSTPMSLNPEGAFAIGIKVGPKSTDTVLIDFVGGVRHHLHHNYSEPSSKEIIASLEDHMAEMVTILPVGLRGRIVGVGISLPEEIDNWAGESWRGVDFEAAVSAFTDLPIYIQNDATAAAGAELIFGAARRMSDFAYFFIGTSSASRLVLNHHIYAGRSGGPAARSDIVSLSDLEKLLIARGIDPTPMWHAPTDWPDFGEALDEWVESCGKNLAKAIAFICGFVDIDTTIIDGRFSEEVRDRLCGVVVANLSDATAFGSDAPHVVAGEVGTFAKAIGASSLPFHTRYMVEQVGLAQS